MTVATAPLVADILQDLVVAATRVVWRKLRGGCRSCLGRSPSCHYR